MRRTRCLAILWLAIPVIAASPRQGPGGPCAAKRYRLESFAAAAFTPGSDILAPLSAAFAAIQAAGVPATLTIPAGDYTCPSLVTAGPCIAPNNCTVVADGVTVTYPADLAGSPDYPDVVFCQGTDVQNFTWHGGTFIGFNYDPSTGTSTGWAPKETVCTFSFGSSSTGCANLTFDGLKGMNSGCMVRVAGVNEVNGQVQLWPTTPSYSFQNTTVACNGVTLLNCNFSNCGQVYFDYGYLWQILTYQSQYPGPLVAMAKQYMNPIGWTTGPTSPYPVSITFSGNLIEFDNSSGVVPAAATGNTAGNPGYMVTFGPGEDGTLPANVTPGLQYYVVASTQTYIQIARSPSGAPIAFTGQPTAGCDMFYNMNRSYWDMFVPDGANQLYDGAWQLVDCANVQVENCTWSSPGDAEVLAACQNSTLTGGAITGARMGALFISGCLNTTVQGLSCNGGDGSRVLSLEYGDTLTTISGCQFTGGGRGSLINFSSDLVLSRNTFTLNSGKTASNSRSVVPDPSGSFATNRITYATGNWEQDPAFLVENSQGSEPSVEVSFIGNSVVVQPTGIAAIEVITALEGWFFEGNSFQVGPAADGAYASIRTSDSNLCGLNFWGPNSGAVVEASLGQP